MASKEEAEADAKRYFDSDNNLSSAGAAASLRYARPRDLPSYPSTGLPKNDNSKQDATKAATLGWQNQRPVEVYKPTPSSSAAQAANLGWKSRAPEQWKPEQSTSGARAAVLAAQRDKDKAKTSPPAQSTPKPAPVERERPKTSSWGNSAANIAVANSRRPATATTQSNLKPASPEKERPKSSSWGNSAANIAVAQSKRPSPPPTQSSVRQAETNRHGSLKAATGAMATPVQRPSSAPGNRPSYPDSANARSNAMRAAAHADNASRRPNPVGGATSTVSMPRGRFTSQPTTNAQLDEKTKAEQRKASAVAMAQQMYKTMQKNEQEAESSKAGAAAATGRRGRTRSLSSDGGAAPPMRFNNINDVATRRAHQKIAAMDDEASQARRMHAYYGTSQPAPPPKRFSVSKLFRRRDSDDDLSDDEGSRRVRRDMSHLQSQLSQVDARRQKEDVARLMAVAERNTKRDMAKIDEENYRKTGKMTPQMQAEVDTRNREAAEAHAAANYEAERQRNMEHTGQAYIGGDTWVEQEQVDAQAQMNTQRVMTAQSNKIQKELDHKEMQRMEADEAKRQAERQKERDAETERLKKDLNRQHKQEGKLSKRFASLRRSKPKTSEAKPDPKQEAAANPSVANPGPDGDDTRMSGAVPLERTATYDKRQIPTGAEMETMSREEIEPYRPHAFTEHVHNERIVDSPYNRYGLGVRGTEEANPEDMEKLTAKRKKRLSLKGIIDKFRGGSSSDDDLDPDKQGKLKKGKEKEKKGMFPGANPKDDTAEAGPSGDGAADTFVAGPPYGSTAATTTQQPAVQEPVSPIDQADVITPTRDQDDSTVSILSTDSIERRRKAEAAPVDVDDDSDGLYGASPPATRVGTTKTEAMFPEQRTASPVAGSSAGHVEPKESRFREGL